MRRLRRRKQSLAQGVRAEVRRAESAVRLSGNEAAVDAAKLTAQRTVV